MKNKDSGTGARAFLANGSTQLDEREREGVRGNLCENIQKRKISSGEREEKGKAETLDLMSEGDKGKANAKHQTRQVRLTKIKAEPLKTSEAKRLTVEGKKNSLDRLRSQERVRHKIGIGGKKPTDVWEEVREGEPNVKKAKKKRSRRYYRGRGRGNEERNEAGKK